MNYKDYLIKERGEKEAKKIICKVQGRTYGNGYGGGDLKKVRKKMSSWTPNNKDMENYYKTDLTRITTNIN